MTSKITQLKDKQQNDLFPVTESSAVMYKDDITVNPTVEDYSKSLDAIIGDTYIGDIISTTTNAPAKTITEALHQAVTGLKYVKDAPSDNGAVLLNDVGGNTSTGANATASGSGNIASGINSFAAGSNNEVLGTNSFVDGLSNKVGGHQDIVGGTDNTITGTNNLVIGNENNVTTNNVVVGGNTNIVNGHNSSISGMNNTVTGNHSIVGGEENTVPFENSFSIGKNNISSVRATFTQGYRNTVGSNGDLSSAFGHDNYINAAESMVAGQQNSVSTNSDSFAFGYFNTVNYTGSSVDATLVGGRSNTSSGRTNLIHGDGNIVGTNISAVFGFKNTLSGAGYQSFVTGQQNLLSSSSSNNIVTGYNNKAEGAYGGRLVGGGYWYDSANVEHAAGKNVVKASSGIAWGYGNTVLWTDTGSNRGNSSVAIGDSNTVIGNECIAVGQENNIGNSQCAGFGYGLYNRLTKNCTFVGAWNEAPTGNGWRFIIGGGTGSGSNRKTILGVGQDGRVYSRYGSGTACGGAFVGGYTSW